MNKGSNKGSEAAEMTDKALQERLNKEAGKILFAHHLKGKCYYLSTNQHRALTSVPDLAGPVTMEIFFTLALWENTAWS